jgi:hypothetical protein
MFHSRPWTSIPRADRVCGANVAISFPKNSVNYRTDFPGAAAAREVPEHQIRGSMGEQLRETAEDEGIHRRKRVDGWIGYAGICGRKVLHDRGHGGNCSVIQGNPSAGQTAFGETAGYDSAEAADKALAEARKDTEKCKGVVE